MSKIRLFQPSIGEEEIAAVTEVLKSGWTGLGPKTQEFEVALEQYLNLPPGTVAVLNSCTAALDMALRLCGVNHGDEVIVPTMTFVSTAHAVVYNHGTPIFCDVDPTTLTLDLDDLERKITPRTKAIIPVHFGGRMVDIPAIEVRVADTLNQNKIYIPRPSIIEDCAHAAGSYIVDDNNKKWFAGTLGKMGCYSFHAVKNISMGDGGALIVNLPPFLTKFDNYTSPVRRAKRLRWLGINKGTWDRSKVDQSYWWEYNCEEVGYKNHSCDILSSIGIVQLAKLDKHNARRREIAELYTSLLKDTPNLQTPEMDTDYSKSSWHIYHIQVPEERRNQLSGTLMEQGIDTGVHYKPIHSYKCYGNTPTLPVAESVWKKVLSLPMHPGLTNEDVEFICSRIKGFLL